MQVSCSFMFVGTAFHGNQGTVERQWQMYFERPTDWWDNRGNKLHSRSPDFRHKITKDGLWIHSWNTPQWVAAALESKTATTIPGIAFESCGDSAAGNSSHLKSPEQDSFSWTTLISEHIKSGRVRRALKTYEEMREAGVKPSSYTLVAALKACSRLQDLESGKQIHAHIVQSGFASDVYVLTMLIDVYAKCGNVVDARLVFENMPHRNVVTWNSIITAYAQMEEGEEALQLYKRMQQEGVELNDRTFLGALKACSSLAALEEGSEVDGIFVKKLSLDRVRGIHSDVVKSGSESDVFVGTMLVDTYGKCGSIVDARTVFDLMPQRNVVSWNAMILGYAQMEKGEEALHLYAQMQEEGVVTNDRTFVGLLKACSSLVASEGGCHGDVKTLCLKQVRDIHADVVQSGCESDTFVGNMLIDVYAKCGSLVDARNVFEKMLHRSVVSWTAMMAGYVQMQECEGALQLYAQMQQEGVVPDARAFVVALKACSAALQEGFERGSKMQCLEQVKAIHMDVVKNGCESDLFVSNMLVDLYAKCGSLVDARHVFDKMRHRNVVSWTAIILGYAQMEEGHLALQLYGRMLEEGVVPDALAFVGALNACASVGGLEKGKEIHAQILQSGLQASDSFVASSLIDMYGKCGSMVDAQQVFDAVLIKGIVPWNALIAGYARHGESQLVFELFEKMKQDGLQPDVVTFLSVLTLCAHAGLLDKGLSFFEAMTIEFGITPTIEHYTCIVDMLGHAGHLDKAMAVVETMPFVPDVAVWETVMCACRKWGNVELGRQAFECAVKLNQDDAAAYFLLSNIYASAHMWKEAKETQAMKLKTQAWKQPGQSWWTDMCGIVHAFYVQDGEHFDRHQFTYAALQDLAGKTERTTSPNKLWKDSFEPGYVSDGEIVCTPVDLSVPQRDEFSWTALISQHNKSGQGKQALSVYKEMRVSGIRPSSYTLVAALKACSRLQDLDSAKQVHAEVVKFGFQSVVFVGNILIDVYAKCRSLMDARSVFETMPFRNVVSWNSMIWGYAHVKQSSEALDLYTRMRQEGVTPDDRTFVGALKACASLAAIDGGLWKTRCLEQVRAIHSDVVSWRCESDVFVGNMLVDVYAKCGSLVSARHVFDMMARRDVVSWNAMILGYAHMGEGDKALQLYAQMRQEGVGPNGRTFIGALKACSALTASHEEDNGKLGRNQCLDQVKAIHSDLVACGFEADIFVGSMLVDVYAKCGSLVDARHVFDRMPSRNVVSWTAMILGYAQMEEADMALQMYTRMQQKGIIPNERTFVGVLQACGSVAGLEMGKAIHAQISESGVEATYLFVASSLVDMYGKCGSMVEAHRVFDALSTKDVVTWSALLAGYARLGESDLVFDLFETMKRGGVQPKAITFLSVLTVCSHAGLLDKGQMYFDSMIKDYSITPTIEHYTCMVDLLGRAGQLDKALLMVETMPFQADGTVWRTVLGACQKWKNVELGKRAFQFAVSLDEHDSASYVLMSNIYAAAHMLEDAKAIHAKRLNIRAWKKPGQSSWTDVSGKVHRFVVGHHKHPESQDICAKLDSLLVKMKQKGYVPHLESVLRDIPDDEKVDALCGHSERQAIAYALLKTPQGTTIRVVKNLRVCEDCHAATALISEIEQRTIICRDASRFHVYKDGKCSCRGYW